MKKLIFVLLLTTGFLMGHSAHAAERINSFDTIAQIQADGSVIVNEKIVYDFGDVQKHGIYRDIPVKYERDVGSYFTLIKVLSVTDNNGKKLTYKLNNYGDNLEIKIGDADKTVTGVKIYDIKYKIDGVVSSFSDHLEFYWNTNGNSWQVPIDKTSAVVKLPKSIISNEAIVACYQGIEGSTDKCDIAKFGLNSTSDSYYFETANLAEKEGMTIVAGFPKNIVAGPSALSKFYFNLIAFYYSGDWLWFFPLLAFIIMFILWFKHGRDAKGRGVIIPQYDVPDDLSPAEVGTLLDSSTNNKDIAAEIIQLAVKGYLIITRIPKTRGILDSDDYLFKKLKEPENLKPWQKTMMNKFFTGKNTEEKLSQITARHFGDDLPNLISNINNAILKRGYFTTSSFKVKTTYIIFGIIIGMMWGISMSLVIDGARPILSGMLTSVIIIIFGIFMPALTKRGAETREHIKGLKLYLSVVEKARLKFHGAPNKDPKKFEQLLPYAMVLGVEKEWAQQFEGIAKTEPDWYHDPTGVSFSTIVLISSLRSFHSSASSSVSSTTHRSFGSRGGSGFSGGSSGGGFGGGGGGSW